MDGLDRQVLDLLREVGERELLPRFRTLAPGQIADKGGGEIVTEADVAAERVLARRLRELLPDSLVVGEEGSEDAPQLLTRVASHECVWLVDPLDGTKHFAAGSEPFGSMVSLVRHGRVEAGFIHMPLSGRS